MKYNHIEIEKKWQKFWDENRTFRTPEFDELDKSKPKYYALDMFPYPSGDGLHVGHPEGYTATDIITRYKIMRGYNVLHPMGWDAFGLPTEQFALKTGIHPKIRTEECIVKFRTQLKAIGFAYDWDREVNTSDPNFYKWTQFIFLKLYNSYFDSTEQKAKPIDQLVIPEGLNEGEIKKFINSQRLAYLADGPVNWCPELGTVLANEEVAEQIEKGYTVIRKNMKQWKLRITKYADRLLDGLNKIDWPESLKEMQRNWIGRKTGANIIFKIKNSDGSSNSIEVFTTRPDTIFGATYMVLAPEHPLVDLITTSEFQTQVNEYKLEAAKKSDMERTELSKDKTGVFTGGYAINPVNGKEIPILISDYVLISYGTGAIMSVPGHDSRDNEFAKKFKLEIVPVVVPEELKDQAIKKISSKEHGEILISGKGLTNLNGEKSEDFANYISKVEKGEECFEGEGYCINSDFLIGLKTSEAIETIINWLEERELGKRAINYKLRDWLFSRQRYWGEPFPILHNGENHFALSESDLPLELPDVESYHPTGTGESPLAVIDEWVNFTDENGNKFKRETNTMPQLAGSSWYFLRYIDPDNSKEFCSKEKEEYWMPVDVYIGGAEHAVGHLLYSRFWTMVLFDLGYVTHEEPFKKLFNQGMILGEDGVKMSKSRGNVINPDDVIHEFGADSMRLFEMFMGPLESTKPWSTEGIAGMNRFLNRAWRLIIDEYSGKIKSTIVNREPNLAELKILNKTIKKVTFDIEDGDMKFNTSIAQLMIFLNEVYKFESISKQLVEMFILILAPFSPHISEELWSRLGNENPVSKESWPEFDEKYVKEDSVTIALSVNGKLRDKVEVDFDTSEKDLEQKALDNEKILKHIMGKEVKRIIVVKNKMVNVVV